MFDAKRAISMKAIIVAIVLTTLVLSGCMGARGWPGVVMDGDTLFVGSRDGTVIALNQVSGVRIWHWEPEVEESANPLLSCTSGGGGRFSAGKLYAPPVAADGVVYIGDYSGRVYAIDADRGTEVWTYDIESPIVGGVTVVANTVFVGSADGELYALDANVASTEGRLKEGFETFQTEGKIWSTPVIQDGSVYFGSLDHRLYAVDASSGELKWDFETGGSIASSPLVVGGVVYIGSFDSKFYAVDAETGSQKWVFDGAGNWFWANAVHNDGIIYACCLDNNVYAIDAGSGKLVWATPFEAGGPIKSSPVIVGGVLVVASEDGIVYGIDLDSGEEIWSFDLEVKALAPLFGYDGKVYVNAQDNRLYTFDGATGQQDWSVALVK